MTFDEALRRALGPTTARSSASEFRDIAGFALGTPRTVVSPQTCDELATILQIANEHACKVVPVGARTAYWRPLDLHETIALDTSQLRGLTFHDDCVIAAAGEPLGELDRALRARGRFLAVHPDAFGDTSIGSAVATGLTSGIGMLRGGIDRWVNGLRVVTAQGQILQTGTGWLRDDAGPFIRDGLPDPTALFVGSEGTLGVIAAVALRTPRCPWLVHIEARASTLEHLLAVAQQAAESDAIDTARISLTMEAHAANASHVWCADLWAYSTFSEHEATARAEAIADQLRTGGVTVRTLHAEDAATRMGRVDAPPDPRWQHPADGHAHFAERYRLIGLDVNAPYDALPALLVHTKHAQQEAIALGAAAARVALYLGDGFVNVGLHASVARELPREPIDAFQTRWLDELGALPVIPYRPGHTWPTTALRRLDPGRGALYRAWRALLDPNDILNPHHPLLTS